MFFKKRFHRATWSDISLAKFYKIIELVKEPDEYTEDNLREVVYGIDPTQYSITELSKYDISFLGQPIETKNVKLKDTYVLNGHKYRSNINLTTVKTNQFIDFTNYARENDKCCEKLLSVFFVPEGHQYNDGYDIREVQEDLKQLDIATVQSLAFFMMEQFRAFAIIFQQYLEKEAKTMPKELQKTANQAAQTIRDLASFQF